MWIALFRALSGGVVHVPGKAATGTTGSPSYGTTVLYIANCTFTSNQADASSSEALNTVSATYGTLAGCGGAVNFIGAALWIQHSTFTDNGATTLGGALMYQQSCPPVSSTSKYFASLHACSVKLLLPIRSQLLSHSLYSTHSVLMLPVQQSAAPPNLLLSPLYTAPSHHLW